MVRFFKISWENMRGSVRTVPEERKSILKLVDSTIENGVVATRTSIRSVGALLITNMLAVCQAML